MSEKVPPTTALVEVHSIKRFKNNGFRNNSLKQIQKVPGMLLLADVSEERFSS